MNEAETEIVRAPSLDEVLGLVDSLDDLEKQELLAKLIGEEKGVRVIFGNGSNPIVRADLVVQIHSADTASLTKILDAIANRIEKSAER